MSDMLLILLAFILLFYIFALMPRLSKRSEMLPFLHTQFAHRGFHCAEKQIPENSIPAFRAALAHGYGIELDVQLTKDDVPVVFHDFTLQRVCAAAGKIRDFTLEELKQFRLDGTKEAIPTLAEVLQLVDGQVPLLVEMKCEDLGVHVCEKADGILKNYRGNYVMESFNPFALLWYRRHRPEICRGQLSMNFQRQEGTYDPQQLIARHLLTNFLAKPDFIAYDIRDKEALSKNICRKWFHCPSVAWTVRSADELRKIKPYYDAFIFEGFRPQVRK